MSYLIAALALLNFGVAAARFIYCIRSHRIISVVWFLIAYFSFFFIPVAFSDSYQHYQGFTATTITIHKDRIEATCYYTYLFNVLFLISETVFGRIAGLHKNNSQWFLPAQSSDLNRVSILYFLYLLFGGAMYAKSTMDFDYKDYVQSRESWSMVFLWASTPLITLSALRKRYFIALLGCIPFVYFAFLLKVRSFALLSIIPVAIIYALQVNAEKKASAVRYLRMALFGGGLVTLLLMSSSLILAHKAGNEKSRFAMPDSNMPFGTGVMMELSDRNKFRTEWDSLALYSRNLINPFIRVGMKLFDMKIEDIEDPPYVMGRFFDDVPKGFPMRLHYPALWYADAYFSFGSYGLLLAIFWAFVLVGWELVMARSTLLLGLLLPFYSWHAYMLIRGATAGASVPIAYALYVTMLTAAFILGPKIFASANYWEGWRSTPARSSAPSRQPLLQNVL